MGTLRTSSSRNASTILVLLGFAFLATAAALRGHDLGFSRRHLLAPIPKPNPAPTAPGLTGPADAAPGPNGTAAAPTAPGLPGPAGAASGPNGTAAAPGLPGPAGAAPGLNGTAAAPGLPGPAGAAPGPNGTAAAPGPSGGTVFDVTTFGATPDGKSDSTQGFMKAWVAACQAKVDQATFLVPPGTYMTGAVLFNGPCNSAKPMVAQIQGTVLGSNELSSYTEDYWVSFSRINGLIVNGGGTFDGQGAEVWKFNDCKANPQCTPLPVSIKFANVMDALVYDINSVNAKFFHWHVTYCTNFTAYNLTFTAPDTSPNTDGIHLSRSDKISVSNTIIGTGDDCISIGDGVTNAVFTGLRCGPGHGLSVGSLGKYADELDVSGIKFINCTIVGADNGARIKSWANSPPSKATGIVFQDITMDAVQNPIIIDQSYGATNPEPSRVQISDVQFNNIKGTSASNVAISLQCSATFPCQGIQMSGIQLTYQGPDPKNTSILASCVNAKTQPSGQNSVVCP